MSSFPSGHIHPDLRINSYGHYLRKRFGCRVSKVNVDAGFTCPNRDGSKGTGGCIYCNNVSFSPRDTQAEISLEDQLTSGMAYHRTRLQSEKFIVYFQKYTNTYAAVEHLADLYQRALAVPDVLGISVGTRPDCLTDAALELLTRIAQDHYVCLELGLQSADDDILQRINRGHSLDDFISAVQRATGRGFDICAHLIYGFPGEQPEEFIKSADLLNGLPGITSVKLHQLHAVEGTELAAMYRRGEFTPLSLDQYLATAVNFLERLAPRISIQRLYGSSPLEIRVAPQWGLKNNQMWYAVLNELKRRDTWQGSKKTVVVSSGGGESMKTRTINVKDREITVSRKEQDEYISLTDIARYKNPNEPIDIIKNWLRSRTTIEFIGLWEQLHNPAFKAVEFDRFMYEAGSNSFVLSPGKWIEATNAIGITTKAGRYGGTFAHQDIAFEFASWVSAEFKLYLLKEFQRLKQEEFDQKKLEWSVSRTIAKVNYLIHTDAIMENLIPPNLQKSKHKFIYADEADLLNLALFGQTALTWKTEHPDLKGNMRDYATLEQLIVLSNLESFNAELIKMGVVAIERLQRLNKMAIEQMKVLVANKSLKTLQHDNKHQPADSGSL